MNIRDGRSFANEYADDVCETTEKLETDRPPWRPHVLFGRPQKARVSKFQGGRHICLYRRAYATLTIFVYLINRQFWYIALPAQIAIITRNKRDRKDENAIFGR